MQLMYPGLGAGVTDHSNFFDDPYDRIFRSIPVIWQTIFADEQEGDERGQFVRDLHKDIKGTDHHGHRYHALDPEVFWWAHATFTWEFFRARELFFPIPATRAQHEQLYAETVTWYRRYGLSERPVPPTLDAFWQKFDDICDTTLEVTPAVAWVVDPTKNPATRSERVHLPGPLSFLNHAATDALSDVQRTIVYGVMPEVVRNKLGHGLDLREKAGFAAICGALRTLTPAINRGFMQQLFPEGTPRLKPGTRDQIITSGTPYVSRAQRQPGKAAQLTAAQQETAQQETAQQETAQQTAAQQ